MRVPVSFNSMLVGKLAVLHSCRGMPLGLFMLADRVMVLCLMVMMRGCMVVRSSVMMVLARGMLRCMCHRETPFHGVVRAKR